MQLNSQSKLVFPTLIAGLILAACSRPAPELPPDYGSVDSKQRVDVEAFSQKQLKLSCGDIEQGLDALAKTEATHEESIKSKRGNNQAAGYIASVLFLPAILATEHSTKAKSALDDIQTRRDKLIALERFKQCSA